MSIGGDSMQNRYRQVREDFGWSRAQMVFNFTPTRFSMPLKLYGFRNTFVIAGAFDNPERTL